MRLIFKLIRRKILIKIEKKTKKTPDDFSGAENKHEVRRGFCLICEERLKLSACEEDFGVLLWQLPAVRWFALLLSSLISV